MGAQKAPEALSTAGINPLVDSQASHTGGSIQGMLGLGTLTLNPKPLNPKPYQHEVPQLPTCCDELRLWIAEYGLRQSNGQVS